MYIVNPGVWTELAEYGIELIHHAGHSVTVEVVDGRIETIPDHVECRLRAPGGVYPEGWRAPVAGWYWFGSSNGHYDTFTTVTLDLGDAMLDAGELMPMDPNYAQARFFEIGPDTPRLHELTHIPEPMVTFQLPQVCPQCEAPIERIGHGEARKDREVGRAWATAHPCGHLVEMNRLH